MLRTAHWYVESASALPDRRTIMPGLRPLISRCAPILFGSSLLGSPIHATPYDLINAAAAKAVIAPERVRPNVFMLEGSGGNITVFEGSDGLFLVDSGIALSRMQ